ncbi:hypothetical protein BGZ99_007671 [Dissophora globulifera]|uniref:EF-hand domain-containing protein n=1 Tax=Dissophora globulifera TaxID=979702 RepID=A0A9P6R8W2_9FUNG|nr:hypothetical protein BGZ99_007671 [Dissophora globulifera]
MSTVAEPDPGLEEAAKDRTSIKLMDLPMQPKKSKSDSSSSSLSSSTAAPLTTSAQSSTIASPTAKAAPGADSTQSTPDHSSLSSLPPSSGQHAPQQPDTNDECDPDLSFLPPSDEKASANKKSSIQEHHHQEQQQQQTQAPRDRVGNPPHYETREERQNRIRKQFNLLDRQRSGFLDTNSLINFFAEFTPDKKVQQRYADELLQLCRSRDDQRARKLETTSGDHRHGSRKREDRLADEDSLKVHDDDDNNGESDNSSSNSGQDDLDNGSRHHGQVRYDDFEVFIEEKEERLWNLFREIDHNNDNEIQPEELQASLAKAGINMTDEDLQLFIKAMDKDGDGMIDYEEWRDFLVLLPRETTLKEIFHYVQEVVAQVGVDGDVVMPPSDTDYVAKYLLAGAIAGAVSRSATAPLDRLKVYLITNSMPALTGPAAQEGLKRIPKFLSPNSGAVAPVRQRLLWTAITELYQQGGIRTFFRGNGLNIIKIAPESAIKFYTYETSKSFIVKHLPSLTVQPHNQHPAGSKAQTTPAHSPDIATSGRFLAGGVAGLVSQFSIYPLETVKTRIMASTGRSQTSHTAGSSPLSLSSSSTAALTGSSSALSAASSSHTAMTAGSTKLCIRSVMREMWQKAGLRGFYRGLGPSLVGIFPYAAIDLSVFETLKFGYMRWKAGVHEGDEGSEEKSLERPSVFVLLACGTISGSVGATSVYPLSLVRTRLQAQGTPQHPQTYTSTLDVFRKTFEQEGVRGFYKGMVPTLTKVVPAVSISYVVYEYSKRELGL